MGFRVDLDDKISLELSRVDVEAAELALTYVVTNGTEVAVYLLNGLFHRRGAAGWEVDRNLVYVEVGPPSVLHVKKQMVEVPDDIDVEYPEVPFATPVSPGGAYEESIAVRLPIEPADPYKPQRRLDEPYDVHQILFILGYVLEDRPLSTSRPSALGAEGLVRLEYSEVRMRQRLKRAGPIAATIPTVAMASAP